MMENFNKSYGDTVFALRYWLLAILFTIVVIVIWNLYKFNGKITSIGPVTVEHSKDTTKVKDTPIISKTSQNHTEIKDVKTVNNINQPKGNVIIENK